MKTQFEELMSGLDDVESFLSGEKEGFKVHVPEKVDVKSIRNKLRMTQARFSDVFGFSLRLQPLTPSSIGEEDAGHRKPTRAPFSGDRQESRRSPHRASAGGLRCCRRIFQGAYCSVQDHEEDPQERPLCCKSFSIWRSLPSVVDITTPVDILR